jgi:hypothetical protein
MPGWVTGLGEGLTAAGIVVLVVIVAAVLAWRAQP